MVSQTIRVEGMSCDHCVETIRKAVGQMGGVSSVEVNLEKKEVSVDFDESKTGASEISAKITDAGFEVVGK